MADVIQRENLAEATEVFVNKMKQFVCLDRNKNANMFITLQDRTEVVFKEKVIVANEVVEKYKRTKSTQTSCASVITTMMKGKLKSAFIHRKLKEKTHWMY